MKKRAESKFDVPGFRACFSSLLSSKQKAFENDPTRVSLLSYTRLLV